MKKPMRWGKSWKFWGEKTFLKWNCSLQALFGIILLGMEGFFCNNPERVGTGKQKPGDPGEFDVLLSRKNIKTTAKNQP